MAKDKIKNVVESKLVELESDVKADVKIIEKWFVTEIKDRFFSTKPVAPVVEPVEPVEPVAPAEPVRVVADANSIITTEQS